MPQQTSQEFERYADRARRGFEKAGNAIEKKAKALGAKVEALKGKAKISGREALHSLQEETIKAAEHFENVVLPKVGAEVKKAAKVVKTHGEVTFRRAAADVTELTSSAKVLAGEKARNFELAKLAVNNHVAIRASMRGFLKSDYAVIPGLDNSNVPAKGIPVFPRAEMLEALKDDFLPKRILITSEGLRCRAYRRNEAVLGDPLRPTYIYQFERAATADDLASLRISASEVIKAVQETRAGEPYREYCADTRAARKKRS